jgi:hypothetical protein
MTMTTKSRVVNRATGVSILNGVPSATWQAGGITETVISEGHDLSLLGKVDTGGECTITKTGTRYDLGKIIGGNWDGSDYLVTNPGPNVLAPRTNMSDAALKGQGTTAIARTDPTNPVFPFSVAVGEVVKDGIPSMLGVNLWKERAHKARAAGSEFLNYEFGWQPLISDINSLVYAVKSQQKILDDYRRGSGKVTRVGYHFPSDTRNAYAPGPISLRTQSGISLGNHPGSRWVREEYDSWFKGAFTYWLPIGNSAAAKAARFAAEADKLYGVDLSPEVLWNLAPWSWAVDWFSNTGDILSNVSSIGNDSLVLKYGYMMFRRSYKERTDIYPSGSNTFGGSDYVSHYFRRVKASPYSWFGAPTALSNVQSAILVALGMTHMR